MRLLTRYSGDVARLFYRAALLLAVATHFKCFPNEAAVRGLLGVAILVALLAVSAEFIAQVTVRALAARKLETLFDQLPPPPPSGGSHA